MTLPPVIGNEATPALEICALPTGAGVSLRLPSALTKPESSATAVSLPLSAGISATGLTAVAVAYVWLGEEPRLVELLGGLVTLVGVAFLHRRPKALALKGEQPAEAAASMPSVPPAAGRPGG